MKEVKLNNGNYNCKNCGSILRFNPNTQSIECDKCKFTYPLEYQKTFTRHIYNPNTANSTERNEWIADNKVFSCDNCGSHIIANKYEMSLTCPYCDTHLIIDKEALPGLKPDGIIPFAFDKKTANEKFVASIKKQFYVNGMFKKQLPDSQIKGTYIPCFVYDMDTTSQYRGTLCVFKRKNGETYRHHFAISGTFEKKYNNIIVESSSKIEQYQLEKILPFETSSAVDYQNEYILGYTVEHYADTLEKCEEVANKSVNRKIRTDILKKYQYDEVSLLNVKTNFKQREYNYILLPVYKFEYKFKNKSYTTYMNGQTGKTDKNLPKSVPKIVMTFILVILLLILLFATQIH